MAGTVVVVVSTVVVVGGSVVVVVVGGTDVVVDDVVVVGGGAVTRTAWPSPHPARTRETTRTRARAKRRGDLVMTDRLRDRADRVESTPVGEEFQVEGGPVSDALPDVEGLDLRQVLLGLGGPGLVVQEKA